MLKQLIIENYTLIKKLDIRFSDGFTVITGETGAGKSILIGALSLILGDRADTQALMDKSKKCIVEGHIIIKDYGIDEFLDNNKLDYEDITIIRREIIPSGKSRAFINDTPVTLSVLKEFGERLVNIHSQHKILTLNDMDFQLAVIDNFAMHGKLVEEYRMIFKEYEKNRILLKELEEKERETKSDEDYYQFLYDELDKANLLIDEQKDIENELEILNHSEEIKTVLNNASDVLANSDENILSQLNNISSMLSKLSDYNEEIKDISKRMEECFIELKDISGELENLNQEIVYDPERIDELNNRLNTIYTLEQKHRVSSVEQLHEIQKSLSEKLNGINKLDDEIASIKNILKDLNNKLLLSGKKISENRKKQLPVIEKELLQLLAQLGMKHASFRIDINDAEGLTRDGLDRVRFLFNANKGGVMQEISKVASGGELSRLMLGIKSLVSRKNLLPTVIFDEIDSGVSGEIADKVGNIMRKMSENMQLIAITHLPQIAAKGDEQLLVYKEIKGSETYTRIKQLGQDSRIDEIAKMLSGEEPTPAAKQTARELLNK